MARDLHLADLLDAALGCGDAGPNRAMRRAWGVHREPARSFEIRPGNRNAKTPGGGWQSGTAQRVSKRPGAPDRKASASPERRVKGEPHAREAKDASVSSPKPSLTPQAASLIARLPAAPALCTPEPVFEWSVPALDIGVLGMEGSLDRTLLAIGAAELGSMAKFDELLCLPTLSGVVPYQYQIDTVRKVLRSLGGRGLLADEVGLGKTVEALMILAEYRLRRQVRRALILVPPALIEHWQSELSSKAGIVARTSSGPELARNADAFWGDEGVVIASLALARGPAHQPRVTATRWDLVVVDEAHHLKNRATAGYRLVDGLSTRFLLLLTATPIETDLEEIYSLVTLLRPGQFATPGAFRKQFVNGADPTSPRNRQQLKSLLSEVMVRNTRAGSGLPLPPRFVTTVTVDPTPAEAGFYQAVVGLLRDSAGHQGSRLVASTLLLQAGSSVQAVLGTLDKVLTGDKHGAEFRAACAGLVEFGAGACKRLQAPPRPASSAVPGGLGKVGALLEILRAHKQQALVFTRYRRSLEWLGDELRTAGIHPAMFHGGLGTPAKQAALEEFRAGAPVLLATEVGGEGQNLQSCSLLVNFDLPWNPMLIEQRIGRLHRMGQEHEVRVYNLAARGTAEERVLDVLDRRLHLFELVVGEMDMVLGNLADERDLEDRILDLYAQTRSDLELDTGFDRIAEELARARGLYERTRAFDAALFRDDYAS